MEKRIIAISDIEGNDINSKLYCNKCNDNKCDLCSNTSYYICGNLIGSMIDSAKLDSVKLKENSYNLRNILKIIYLISIKNELNKNNDEMYRPNLEVSDKINITLKKHLY